MINIVSYQPVLLHVLFQCDHRTLLKLRLANKAIKSLIESYQKSLVGHLSNDVIFDDAWFLRESKEQQLSSLIRGCRLLSRNETAHHLVSQTLQGRMYFSSFACWIDIRDRGIQPIYDSFLKGWCIMWHLADIAAELRPRESDCENPTSRSKPTYASLKEVLRMRRLRRLLSFTTQWSGKLSKKASTEQSLRESILHQWLSFFDQLSSEDVFCFNMAWHTTQSFLHFLDKNTLFRLGIFYNDVDEDYVWLLWYILLAGPRFLERLWLDCDTVLPLIYLGSLNMPLNEGEMTKLKGEYSRRSLRQVCGETDAASTLLARANTRLDCNGRDWRDFGRELGRQWMNQLTLEEQVTIDWRMWELIRGPIPAPAILGLN